MSSSQQKMYHTQEQREHRLKAPVRCIRNDAWLGSAYYFWHDIVDAKQWGYSSKTETERFEVYEGDIDIKDVLDTVFNKEHYEWWLEQIEIAVKEIKRIKSSNKKPTLKQLNDFFKGSGAWDDIKGVMFQDLSENPDLLLIAPIETSRGPKPFVYRKRIQLALYDLSFLTNFRLNATLNRK